MSFPAQIKDIVYKLLQEPTLDNFREFIRNNTGEHNSIDFKGQWIQGNQLAKEMLAIANSGGGVVIFGISENADGSIDLSGLQGLKDPANVSNEVKNYISTDLKYELYPFSYTASEYPALEGRHYQMLVIEDTPQFIPFMAKKESDKLKTNEIYVRRGTSCEVANQDEIRALVSRRINYVHPLKGQPLSLEEHLKQLKVLYGQIEKKKVYYSTENMEGLSVILKGIVELFGKNQTVVDNPLYPDENYEAFISRLIVNKKNKIERILDLY